jgi:CubicO group peptidase (beta-lactamase class C family)
MAKSVTNALVGILVKEKRLFLESPAPVPEWQRQDDPRRGITLDQLLRMTSGLRFDEDSGNLRSDGIRMLLGVADSARYAASKPLVAPPGTRWSYSSGASQIVSGIIRRTIADDRGYLEFPRRALFDRIGMRTAVMEPDASGTFVGSSFVFASARDWARLGLLYLRDGVWDGERILPEGWVAYTRRRTTVAPRQPYGTYGAHFWLTSPGDIEGGAVPSRLPDSFSAIGHEAQYLTVVPSRDLVIVRLGLTRHFTAWDQGRFLELVLKAVSG